MKKSDILSRRLSLAAVTLAGCLLAWMAPGCEVPTSAAPETPRQVVFQANGGTGEMKPQSARPKSQVTLSPRLFQRDGYAFSEWTTTASGQGNRYDDGATLTMPPQDLTLYAQWSPDPHQILFDGNGGEGTMAAQTLGTGQTASLSIHGFSRAGYRFTGWNSAATGNGTGYAEGAPFTMGKQSVTLYAQWGGIDTAVTFYPNGAQGAPRFQVAPTGTKFRLDVNVYTLPGYVFSGWNTNPLGGGISWADGATLTMEPLGLSLYAQWAPRSNTVAFQANGGTGAMPALTVATDAQASLPAAAFTREGYSFAGWNTSALGGGEAFADQARFTMGSESVTLFAQWTPKTNALAFQANGGTGAMASQTLATGATVNLPRATFTRTGYTFTGWNTLAAGGGAGYSDQAEFSMGTASTTLYAQWSPNRYRVQFVPGRGFGTMEPQSIETGATAALNPVAFTRPGYSFSAWTTGYDGGGTAYLDGAPFTMSTHDEWLYAQWRSLEQTVTFDPNGGTGTMAPIHAATDAFFTPAPNQFVRPGYDFTGWNSQPSGSGAWYSSGAQDVMGPAPLVLYAQWKVQYHQVLFDPNGGSGSLSMFSQPTAATITLPANTMTRQGQLFVGWNTQAAGGGTAFANGATLKIGIADLILYAQWIPLRWTSISYDSTRSPSDCWAATTGVATDGTTLLVGTRGSPSTAGNVTGGGLLRTTDRGQTWTQFTVANGLASSEVSGVAVAGANYYAATAHGLSVSRDSGATWSTWTAASGLADDVTYSVSVSGNALAVGTLSGVSLSFDGGRSWSSSSTPQGLGSRVVQDVKMAAGKVYAATNGGLSISSDSGKSWVNSTTAQGLPSNQVWGVGVTAGGIWAATAGGPSFSSDGGATWSSVPFRWGIAGLRCFGLATEGPRVCFATESGLFVSADEGASWSFFTEGHGLPTLAVGAVAVQGGTIAASTAGGIALTYDAGSAWTNHSVARALGANVVNQVVASEGRVYAATAGGLSISSDGGGSWTNLTKAEGLASTEVRDVAVLGRRIFAVTDTWLSVSGDGGTTWSKVNPFNHRPGDPYDEYSLYAVAASGSTVCVGGYGGAFVSTDSGASWSTVTAADGLVANNVADVAVEGDTIAVGTGSGLSLSTDRGRTWRKVGSQTSVPWVALFGGKIFAGSWVSSDAGATWRYLGFMDGGASLSVDDVAVDGTTLYAATWHGVFASTDDGSTWSKNDRTQGLPANAVGRVTVSDSKIYAATSGGIGIGTLGR